MIYIITGILAGCLLLLVSGYGLGRGARIDPDLCGQCRRHLFPPTAVLAPVIPLPARGRLVPHPYEPDDPEGWTMPKGGTTFSEISQEWAVLEQQQRGWPAP